jgi:Histidine kinase-, DNA gyrase B-, and HSP90-like ATPase
MQIKAGIDASGYRTAVRDYTEPTVLEELAANSYDADASTCVVLLDTSKALLHVLDDGIGFSEDAIRQLAILGGGSKQDVPFSLGNRHYLGSYGYGLKSSLNISDRVHLDTISEDGKFSGNLDWSKLDEALRPDFPGFNFDHTPSVKGYAGTHLTIKLKNPPSKDQLDRFAGVLANLPNDGGKFLCFVGAFDEVVKNAPNVLVDFGKLALTAKRLEKKGYLTLAYTSVQADLDVCEQIEFADKVDPKVTAKIFFAGMKSGQVNQLKRGLRGIYVRIHGRLLKQSFTDSTFTYNISKWKKFESGLRVELSVDWLRDQITLSREGIRFANPKLETEFRGLISRCISRFIQPQLKKLEIKGAKTSRKKQDQRLELARKRIERDPSILVPGLKNGFAFRPETDGELALLLAHSEVMKKINPNYSVIDYNDQAPFDCVFYDRSTLTMIKVELEPTLIEWLAHRETSEIELIVVWTLGKWRTGAKKKGAAGYNKLVSDEPESPGRYRLLEFAADKSKNPRKSYKVVALDELL